MPQALDPVALMEVRTGKARSLGAHGLKSAIQKDARDGAIEVSTLGLEGDEQSDRNFHGGPDKAILHYAVEHYDAWQKEVPDRRMLLGAGAFGENLVSRGINETNICVGDVLEIGSAVLQVTQPRQPCFKLNHRFQLPSMARRVQETGRTGWYYRVLISGRIEAGDAIRLAERKYPKWTLRHVQHFLYTDTLNDAALRELIALEPLSEPMRRIFAGRLNSATPESWDSRLIGFNEAGTTVGDDDRKGWRIVRVDGVTQQAPSVKSFGLSDPSGRALGGYPAGAHIAVELSNGIVRNYSLCGPQGSSHYEIAVARGPDSSGGSWFFHETMKPGDIVSISPPRDRFSLAASASRHLMIAGGIGITPFLSMIERCSRERRAFELHYCLRTRGDLVFPERFCSLLPGRIVIHYSRETGGGRADIPGLLQRQAPDTHVYCCGPEELMKTVREATADWAQQRVHFERFVTKTLNGMPFPIKIASTGQIIEVGSGSSILQALRRAGFELASSCETGSCGTCCVGLLDGKAEHRDVILTETQRKKEIALCVSRSRGNMLTLDL